MHRLAATRGDVLVLHSSCLRDSSWDSTQKKTRDHFLFGVRNSIARATPLCKTLLGDFSCLKIRILLHFSLLQERSDFVLEIRRRHTETPTPVCSPLYFSQTIQHIITVTFKDLALLCQQVRHTNAHARFSCGLYSRIQPIREDLDDLTCVSIHFHRYQAREARVRALCDRKSGKTAY